MKEGTEQTKWFEWLGATPVTEPSAHWGSDYRAVVAARIALIENDQAIALIERQNCKRRWESPSWESLERNAIHSWLLDRLESPRYWPLDEPQLVSTHSLADVARHDADFLSVVTLYTGDAAFNLETLMAELVTRESVPFLAPLRYSETGLRKRVDWETTWDRQRQEDAIDAEVERHEKQKQQDAWAQSHSRQDGETAQGYAARRQATLAEPERAAALQRAIERQAKQRKVAEVGTIPVPPKYKQADFLSADFWRLRGGLDVPKERFVSFPHCARDADGSLPVLWAGYDHLARAKAIAAWYVERKDTDGWPAPRLVPLLAGLLELVPWLRQWHNDVDLATGLRMGDYFADFIGDECRSLGLNLTELRDWKPPAPARRPRSRHRQQNVRTLALDT